MSVMCLIDGSHWPATTAEYQKKIPWCSNSIGGNNDDVGGGGGSTSGGGGGGRVATK